MLMPDYQPQICAQFQQFISILLVLLAVIAFPKLSFRRIRHGATTPTPARRSDRSAPATRLLPIPTIR